MNVCYNILFMKEETGDFIVLEGDSGMGGWGYQDAAILDLEGLTGILIVKMRFTTLSGKIILRGIESE